MKHNTKMPNKNEFQYKRGIDQLYGKVVKRLGGKPPIIEILCEDNIPRRCVVRGKFTKRVWINPEDIVLIQVENETTGEIVCKYNSGDVKRLVKEGKIKTEWLGQGEETVFEEGADSTSIEEDSNDGGDTFEAQLNNFIDNI
jgi:initiation factor 1A